METPGTLSRRLRRPGGRLAYDVRGSGPLLVCVPGMGDLRGTFRHLVPALVEAGYRVATVDLRGHGGSDTTFDAYDAQAAAGDVEALVAELGGPAVLVGNSLGASVAALVAARSPQDVSALVLCGPFLRDPQLPAPARLAFRVLTGGPWAAAAWRAWLPRLYAGRVPADHDAYLREVSANLREPARRRAFSRTTRTSHRETEASLGAVRAPALVVVGALDPDFPDPAAEARWAAGALGGTALLVEEAGHYPAAQRPDVVAPAVVEFLATLDARA
ncbi:alpha/beta hydrolase [Kineococcus sp. NUM-3379]